MSKRTLVLAILDGWGIGRRDESNPIHVVDPKHFAIIKSHFPSGSLQASGISVGLPWGEEGNSEVGHLTIGAGTIIYQHYPRITLAIRDGSFFKNEALANAFAHASKHQSAAHLVGLLSQGNVHTSLGHLDALLHFAAQKKIERAYLHLFTDGRDSPPHSALDLLGKIPRDRLASVTGRFYAMDREGHWDRTERTYQTLTGKGPLIDASDLETHIKAIYAKNFNDEYVEPALIGPENHGIRENDAVIFFNFREDRIRQIVAAFVEPNFTRFPRESFKNLYVATMTQYDPSFLVPVAFPPETVKESLGRVLAARGKTQFRIAETQKYPHVTYFFNGLVEPPLENEFRVLIPTLATIHPDEHPEMKAKEITTRIIESLDERIFDFILVNYANPDIIAHTGNYQASIEAVKVIDEEIGRLADACLAHRDILIVTSDHGNIERLFDPATGRPETQHDPSPVPIYLIAKEFERVRSDAEIAERGRGVTGILSDVAPTVLELMGIPKPEEMSGQSLLPLLI